MPTSLPSARNTVTRALQPNEVENAIISRQGQLQTGTPPRPRWPKAAPSVIAEITARPTSVASLFELSPMPVDDYNSEKIIDYLFPGNPLLCCGVSSRTFATRHKEEWRGKLDKMQLIVPSPMSDKYGTTQAGKESMHTMENTGPRAYLVVEFDEGSHDDHASLLWHLNSGSYATYLRRHVREQVPARMVQGRWLARGNAEKLLHARHHNRSRPRHLDKIPVRPNARRYARQRRNPKKPSTSPINYYDPGRTSQNPTHPNPDMVFHFRARFSDEKQSRPIHPHLIRYV